MNLEASVRSRGTDDAKRSERDLIEAGLIGIGGRLTAPPLPHHRAYGSRTTAVRPS
jgi:hypothetical protein